MLYIFIRKIIFIKILNSSIALSSMSFIIFLLSFNKSDIFISYLYIKIGFNPFCTKLKVYLGFLIILYNPLISPTIVSVVIPVSPILVRLLLNYLIP